MGAGRNPRPLGRGGCQEFILKELVMLTDSEKKRRQYRVNFAINNNAIEGLFVSDELKELLKLWVNDEITLEEVEKKIYALWR